MPDLIDDPEYRLTLRQADQAREDFAAILDELEFVKGQLNARMAQPNGVDGLRQPVGAIGGGRAAHHAMAAEAGAAPRTAIRVGQQNQVRRLPLGPAPW